MLSKLKNIDKTIKICTVIGLNFLIATMWVAVSDRGHFVIEGCIAKYGIVSFCFMVAFFMLSDKIPKKIKKELLFIAGVVTVIAALCVLLKLLGYSFSKGKNIFLIIGMLCIILVFVRYSKGIISEELFLTMIVFIVGTVYSLSYPAATGMSYDDQDHYRNILYESHLGERTITNADYLLISSAYNDTLNLLKGHEYADLEKEVNLSYESDYNLVYPPIMLDNLKLGWIVSYLPEAVALFFLRALPLHYTYIFILGRWIGVFLYSLLLYLSMKRVKSGKLILFAISMLPTVLFIMSNYSYDSFGIAFIILSFSTYLGIMQDENRQFTVKDVLIICILFAIGCTAKPPYFLLIFAFLNQKKDKMGDRLTPLLYNTIIIVTGVLIMASFVLPYLIEGTGGDDIRSGNDVNSSAQIMFIIHHMWQYAIILAKFMGSYWSFSSIKYYTVVFVRLGDYIHPYILYIIFLFGIIILDKGEEDMKVTNMIRRGATLILAFCTTALIATIFYIAYTGVGEEVIQGCQNRYILPVLPFVLYYISDYRIVRRIRQIVTQKMLNYLAALVTSGYALYAIYDKVLLYQ